MNKIKPVIEDYGPYDNKKVAVGSKITRWLVNEIPMNFVVLSIEDGIIYVGGGWTFDLETGTEVDDYLQWGPKYGFTGSTLTNGHVSNANNDFATIESSVEQADKMDKLENDILDPMTTITTDFMKKLIETLDNDKTA